jgi:hypothetical protein
MPVTTLFVITNAFGSVTSRAAALSVSYSPALVKVFNTSAKGGAIGYSANLIIRETATKTRLALA